MAHFHRSAKRLANLRVVQQQEDLPTNQPPTTGNKTQWHYTHDSMEWFRVQHKAVVLRSIDYGNDATDEEGPFAQHHLDYQDWENLKVCVAVLQPAATIVNDLEGTLYVTASLFVPCVYAVLKKASKRDVYCQWYESKIPDGTLEPELRAARSNFKTALED